ncbi:MAG: DUF4440 domain-containing protein, partial [Bacteroidota bacterium]
LALALLAWFVLAGCGGSASVAEEEPPTLDAAIQATLEAQVAAWNAGSVRGFMEGYVRADSLTFLSGGSVRRGWEEALYAYVRGSPDAEAMGTLAFEEVSIRPLSPTRALVWGRWRLRRADDAPSGLFTLIFADTPEGWRIMHDHTSSD